MKSIKIKNITYSIEGDHYNGDLLLISSDGAHQLVIRDGYIELRCWALDAHGYMDQLTESVECSEEDVQGFIDANIDDFIIENYDQAEFETGEVSGIKTTRQFENSQLVKKGEVTARVLAYEPTNKKYFIEAITQLYSWKTMWIEAHRLKPLMS